MTFTVTPLARKATIGTGTAWTSGTFDTVTGGEIWIAVFGSNATAFTMGSNTGGWTFAAVPSVGDNHHSGFPDYRVQCWKVTNDASQSGRTVDVNSASGDGYDAMVWQVTSSVVGFDILQSKAYGGASGEPVTVGTLDTAATSGNLMMLLFGINEDGAGHALSITDWTATSTSTFNNAFNGVNLMTRTNFTGTSVDVAEYANTPTWGMGTLIELEETGVPPTPMLRSVVRSNVTLA